MQDVTSVLRDRGFVQMAAGVPVKFKSSVARRMHLARRYPKAEHWGVLDAVAAPSRRYLPLTAVKAAGFNPVKAGERTDGR
jgi:hypothetical protein